MSIDTSELEAAGRAVSMAAAAGGLRGRAQIGKRWEATQVLAHLVAANRNAAELAARVLAGAESATFTNQAALEDTYLEAIVRAAARGGILEEFERSTAVLTATCAALEGKALETPVEARLWDDGAVVFEQTVPLAQVLAIVRGHMEGHAAQLQELGSAHKGERRLALHVFPG
ncbi:MAG TPA: hypothetical protein VF160_15125 [Candidatus Dormibacteraeota bacterium]